MKQEINTLRLPSDRKRNARALGPASVQRRYLISQSLTRFIRCHHKLSLAYHEEVSLTRLFLCNRWIGWSDRFSLYLGCAGNDEHGTYGKSHLVLVLPPLFEYGLEPTTVVQVSISEIVAKYQVMRGSDPRDRMV